MVNSLFQIIGIYSLWSKKPLSLFIAKYIFIGILMILNHQKYR